MKTAPGDSGAPLTQNAQEKLFLALTGHLDPNSRCTTPGSGEQQTRTKMYVLLYETSAAVFRTQTADANAKHRRTPEKPHFSWRTFIRYTRLDVFTANHGATQTRLRPKAWFKASLHDTKASASSISLQWRRLKAWLTKWRRYLLVGQVATSGYFWVECHTNLEGLQSRLNNSTRLRKHMLKNDQIWRLEVNTKRLPVWERVNSGACEAMQTAAR